MNERIRELAEQAETKEIGYYFFDREKFAELIVRECVDICRDIDGEDNIDARSGRQDCAVEIQEHFGVEERKDLVCPKCGVDRTLVDELQIECDRLYRIIELNGILK